MVALAGEDNQAVGEHVVAGVRWFVATREKVHIQHFGERIQGGVRLAPAPQERSMWAEL